jgi:hypothetical protein
LTFAVRRLYDALTHADPVLRSKTMAHTLTEWLQQSRLVVVQVDTSAGKLRVRGEADACTELSCADHTIVVSDEGAGGLETLNPGDIIKVEPTVERPERVIVVRRVWEEIASPEI